MLAAFVDFLLFFFFAFWAATGVLLSLAFSVDFLFFFWDVFLATYLLLLFLEVLLAALEGFDGVGWHQSRQCAGRKIQTCAAEASCFEGTK